jgi:hypothetical protein
MALRVNSPVLSPFLLASARRPDLRGNGICSGQGPPADGKVGRQHYVPSRHGAGDRPKRCERRSVLGEARAEGQ